VAPAVAAAALAAVVAAAAAVPLLAAAATGDGGGRPSAEGLVGRDVVGPDGDKVAEVADLVVEPDGTVRDAIVRVGGFLGVGARPVALELERLGPGPDGALRTALPRERLLDLPRRDRDAEGRYPPPPGCP
jgi:hypothetical protein